MSKQRAGESYYVPYPQLLPGTLLHAFLYVQHQTFGNTWDKVPFQTPENY